MPRFTSRTIFAIAFTLVVWASAFAGIRARLSFIGISSDWLFPAEEVRRFAEAIRKAGAYADYREMQSDHGHDAFLAEQAELVRLLQ